MDYEMVYYILGIAIFLFIVYKVLNGKASIKIQTKEEKRIDIVDGYKKQLKDELELVKDDAQNRVLKKTQLLKIISEELSRNIFFDADDTRDIILELSKM